MGVTSIGQRLKGLIPSFGSPHKDALTASLRAQVDATLLGADLCRALAAGEKIAAAARLEMTEIEHLGDRHRGELVDAMATTLVTPIDREDLFRLSRSVDDVLDSLRDFVSEYDLFEVQSPCGLFTMIEALATGLREFRTAVDGMIERTGEALVASLATKKRCRAIRQGFEEALAELFRQPVTSDVLKNRELLSRLDKAGVALGEAADALADGALKRST